MAMTRRWEPFILRRPAIKAHKKNSTGAVALLHSLQFSRAVEGFNAVLGLVEA